MTLETRQTLRDTLFRIYGHKRGDDAVGKPLAEEAVKDLKVAVAANHSGVFALGENRVVGVLGQQPSFFLLNRDLGRRFCPTRKKEERQKKKIRK